LSKEKGNEQHVEDKPINEEIEGKSKMEND